MMDKIQKVLRKFVVLGIINYYQRFVEGFSNLAAPLTTLTRMGQGYKWTQKCEGSFQELLRRLTNAPVLTIPKEDKGTFVIYGSAMK